MSATLTARLAAALASAPAGAIAVGYSGGLDSTVLLHALAQSAAARARGLRALHVDHALQASSAQWAARCSATAAALGVACSVVRATVALPARGGVESAARAARHAAFADALSPGELLALAHHADDQAETVLLKLLRGAGPEGLAGMRALRGFAGGFLWRPLLEVPRATLAEYARDHALRWIDDPSNADVRLRRNFLRARILPALREHWPDAAVAIAHSARWSGAAAVFIEKHACEALGRLQADDGASLAWRGWLELDAALRDPVLRLWLRSRGLDEPAHFHVAELERQLRGGSQHALCVRWGECEVHRYRDRLYAMRPLPAIAPDWRAAWNGLAPLALPAGGSIALAPLTDAPAPAVREPVALVVGYRHGGERLRPAGGAHTRELRLLLQEAGVPPWQRERMPLLWRDGALLAVGDLFLSAAGQAFCDAARAHIVWER